MKKELRPTHLHPEISSVRTDDWINLYGKWRTKQQQIWVVHDFALGYIEFVAAIKHLVQCTAGSYGMSGWMWENNR